jgi:hypothetical protein
MDRDYIYIYISVDEKCSQTIQTLRDMPF